MMVVVFVAMLAACGQGRGGDAWTPLDNGSLSIAPGTALDFSPFADQSPAGNHGRLIVNARGEEERTQWIPLLNPGLAVQHMFPPKHVAGAVEAPGGPGE